ncbi:YceI family protein [Methylopila sp. M107]|uniref:YceI family protein n=1 Tax=Methylopila sp. M107 TaxID=1101190 RepID=UPI00036D4853|nr:YceI family protein [Methylopila sp. M107]
MSSAAQAGANHAIDQSKTHVGFDIGSLGFGKTHGEFRSVSARLDVDFDKPQNSSVDFTVATASVDTGSRQLDDYIKGTFLDATDYPQMSFRSTSVRKLDAASVEVRGDLTLHGVTRPLTVRVAVDGAESRAALGLTATAVIRRSDFGMKEAIPLVSDDVSIRVSTRTVVGN